VEKGMEEHTPLHSRAKEQELKENNRKLSLEFRTREQKMGSRKAGKGQS